MGDAVGVSTRVTKEQLEVVNFSRTDTKRLPEGSLFVSVLSLGIFHYLNKRGTCIKVYFYAWNECSLRKLVYMNSTHSGYFCSSNDSKTISERLRFLTNSLPDCSVRAPTKMAPFAGCSFLYWCSHQESNLDLRYRKPKFYPLNYESKCFVLYQVKFVHRPSYRRCSGSMIFFSASRRTKISRTS